MGQKPAKNKNAAADEAERLKIPPFLHGIRYSSERKLWLLQLKCVLMGPEGAGLHSLIRRKNLSAQCNVGR